MGIASNTCMHFKYNSYSHYILGHHNVKVCSCRQAEYNNSNSNSAARDLFVYTRVVAKQAHNTYISIAVWTGTGSG